LTAEGGLPYAAALTNKEGSRMKRSIVVCIAAVVFTGSAWAQGKEAKPAAPPAQGGAMNMDMTKMGPMARKPTNEKQTKK
jgi:hypothetical protein